METPKIANAKLLVGFPTVSSMGILYAQYESAPVHVDFNVAFLSPPYAGAPSLKLAEIASEASFTLVEFVRAYNPNIGRSEFLGRLQPVDPLYTLPPGFQPYFKFVNDPNRSRAVRYYLNALASALLGKVISLTMAEVDSGFELEADIPGEESINLADNFNPEAGSLWDSSSGIHS